jgi:hypothetical protein
MPSMCFPKHLFWLLCCTIVLASCAGGGNGSALQVERSTVAFTSFGDLQADKNVLAAGVSQSATLTMDIPSELVTNSVIDATDTATTQLTLGYDSSVNLDSVTVKSATTNLNWSTASGDSISDTGVTYDVISADGLSTVGLGDAVDAWVNWNYQTFGVWQSTTVVGPTATIKMGAISAGNLSPVSGIPTSGGAIYAGVTSGVYVDAAGVLYSYNASLASNADFLNKTLSFDTIGTMIANASSGVVTSTPGLNLNGTMTYGAGSSQFSGGLDSADLSLSGTAVGNFYGPMADEIGGTYALTGTGTETMIGGFGARR